MRNENGINVLSFFDGMSAGQEALMQLGVKVNRYIAVEIDSSAIEITQSNFPNTEQNGSILIIEKDLKEWVSKLPKIDLIFAGSPCQGFSRSGKGKGFNHPRSKLFWTFVDIFNEIKEQQRNPDIPFFFENVVMHERWASIISNALGVKEELYDSTHYSPNARARLYWTNLRPPRAIIEKYKQEGGWKTYQDILNLSALSTDRIVCYSPDKDKKPFKDEYHPISWKKKLNRNKVDSSFKASNIAWYKREKDNQAWRIQRIDGKMACFVGNYVGMDKGRGAFAIGKSTLGNNVFRKMLAYMHPKSKRPPILLEPTEEVIRVLQLDFREGLVLRPSFKEQLEAMGFNQYYYSTPEIKSLPISKKSIAIGNSWHVTIVKLLVEWYCRTSGWIK